MVIHLHPRPILMSYHHPLTTISHRLNTILNLTTNHNLINSRSHNITRPNNSIDTTHLLLGMHHTTLTPVKRGACQARLGMVPRDKGAREPFPYLRQVPGTNSTLIRLINPTMAQWVDQA